MTFRLASSVVLLVAMNAAADDRKYTIAELEALVARSAWIEAAQHLGDVPPSKRTAAWIRVATKTAVGRASSAEKGWALPHMLELEDQFPELLASASYVQARSPVMYKALEGCMDPHTVGACMGIAERAVKAVPKDRAFALKVAKLGRRSVMADDALPLFVLALRPKDNATVCQDEDLRLAVMAGLALSAGDERLTQAASIGFGTCWPALMTPILDELDKAGADSEFRANVCKRLKAKRQVTKQQAAACARKR